jgi:hypothetical protein
MPGVADHYPRQESRKCHNYQPSQWLGASDVENSLPSLTYPQEAQIPTVSYSGIFFNLWARTPYVKPVREAETTTYPSID